MFWNRLPHLLLLPLSFAWAEVSSPSEVASSDASKSRREIVLKNPGFEDGFRGWLARETPEMGVVTPKAAHRGTKGLRVSDTSRKDGSSISVERFAVQPGKAYRINFASRLISGGGVAVFLRFFDSEGKHLNSGMDSVSVHGNSPTPWRIFHLETIAPNDAKKGDLWVRTYAGAEVVVDFDDFEVVEFEALAEPPWEPQYKLTADEGERLTDADVLGPDGIVYPDWRQAGVPGGIPVIPVVHGPEVFDDLLEKDVSSVLQDAIEEIQKQGGGAIKLPAGTFYLDRPLTISGDGVVIRGAGREATRLIFRYHIPYGEIHRFDWVRGEAQGPGTTLEFHTNPKGLVAFRIRSGDRVLNQELRRPHWGNRFTITVTGDALLDALGPGTHRLEVDAEYDGGDVFKKTFDVVVSKDVKPRPHPHQHAAIAIIGEGVIGDPVLLTADGIRGSRRVLVELGHSLSAGDRVQIEAPVTERWSEIVGHHATSRQFRINYLEIVDAGKDWVEFAQPLRMDFPLADKSFLQRVRMIEGCGVEALTIEQLVRTTELEGDKIEHTLWYPIEDLWTNGITISNAWGCWVKDLGVVNTGRNAIYLPRTKFCEVRDCEFNGAIFKGGGGTGYVGFERSFDCLMESVVTRGMRHAPNLQWGAAGNVIRNSRFYGSDAQWHAGWTHENLLENNFVESLEDGGGYGFGMFASGPSSGAHGPQGPRNVIYYNDVSSPKDAIHMMGGNEGWIFAWNRFRVEKGRALFAREKSFDHRIIGNVFAIKDPVNPVVYFGHPNCVGIELIDNRFYGPIREIVGFLGRTGKLAVNRGNEILEFTTDIPRPSPAVKSIFEWQREHPGKSKEPPTDKG